MNIFHATNFKTVNKDSTAKKSSNKRLSALTMGASIAAIGALSMTAPTLASAKTIQPSSANYNFTVEDKYKGTATRTLNKSGNVWKYDVNAKVAGVASASQKALLLLMATVWHRPKLVLLTSYSALVALITSALIRAKSKLLVVIKVKLLT